MCTVCALDEAREGVLVNAVSHIIMCTVCAWAREGVLDVEYVLCHGDRHAHTACAYRWVSMPC